MNLNDSFARLDLRHMRCPLALLTAKRWLMQQGQGVPCELWLSQRAEHQDILRWLQRQGWHFSRTAQQQGVIIHLFTPDKLHD